MYTQSYKERRFTQLCLQAAATSLPSPPAATSTDATGQEIPENNNRERERDREREREREREIEIGRARINETQGKRERERARRETHKERDRERSGREQERLVPTCCDDLFVCVGSAGRTTLEKRMKFAPNTHCRHLRLNMFLR